MSQKWVAHSYRGGIPQQGAFRYDGDLRHTFSFILLSKLDFCHWSTQVSRMFHMRQEFLVPAFPTTWPSKALLCSFFSCPSFFILLFHIGVFWHTRDYNIIAHFMYPTWCIMRLLFLFKTYTLQCKCMHKARFALMRWMFTFGERVK